MLRTTNDCENPFITVMERHRDVIKGNKANPSPNVSLANKVFDQVKSRSVHMKTHKSASTAAAALAAANSSSSFTSTATNGQD
ncbi:hypothetical protein DAPPUDRAFT_276543, partial [Daphnia pulex]